VALTQELVRIDSVIRPETGNTEHGVVEYLRDWITRELETEPASPKGTGAGGAWTPLGESCGRSASSAGAPAT
jgi:hypothetical protein